MLSIMAADYEGHQLSLHFWTQISVKLGSKSIKLQVKITIKGRVQVLHL